MKIVAFDIETTDLRANMGVMLCASFLHIVPPGYYSNHRRTPTKPYTLYMTRDKALPYDPNPDEELAVSVRDELEKYNLVVTWNGKMFDVPFLNARLLFHGERRAHLQWHLDLMYQAGGTQNRIGGRALATVQQFLGVPQEEGKTRLEWDVWKAAGLGDVSALKKVMRHCEKDVEVLSMAYWKLLGGVSRLERSR